MKEKLLLSIADIFGEFKFKDPYCLPEGLSHQYIVTVYTGLLSANEINRVTSIHPFTVSIEPLENKGGFILRFSIKR